MTELNKFVELLIASRSQVGSDRESQLVLCPTHQRSVAVFNELRTRGLAGAQSMHLHRFLNDSEITEILKKFNTNDVWTIILDLGIMSRLCFMNHEIRSESSIDYFWAGDKPVEGQWQWKETKAAMADAGRHDRFLEFSREADLDDCLDDGDSDYDFIRNWVSSGRPGLARIQADLKFLYQDKDADEDEEDEAPRKAKRAPTVETTYGVPRYPMLSDEANEKYRLQHQLVLHQIVANQKAGIQSVVVGDARNRLEWMRSQLRGLGVTSVAVCHNHPTTRVVSTMLQEFGTAELDVLLVSATMLNRIKRSNSRIAGYPDNQTVWYSTTPLSPIVLELVDKVSGGNVQFRVWAGCSAQRPTTLNVGDFDPEVVAKVCPLASLAQDAAQTKLKSLETEIAELKAALFQSERKVKMQVRPSDVLRRYAAGAVEVSMNNHEALTLASYLEHLECVVKQVVESSLMDNPKTRVLIDDTLRLGQIVAEQMGDQ